MALDQLSIDDFAYVADVVRDRAAIVLEPGKEYLVETRLRPLLRQLQYATIHDLIEAARKHVRGSVEASIVEALTTNETHFYRDTSFYDVLKEGVLPELIEKRRPERKLSFWCAACSSGQEPYSILMLLHEHFSEVLDWDLFFLASDLSQQMLERTRKGRYSVHEANRGLPANLLMKYFDRDGVHWQVKEELRSMLEVRSVNLAKQWAPMPKLDLVFMRNVLIYFDVETKKEVLDRVKGVMKTDGLLFLGGSETLFGIDKNFQRSAHGKASCYELPPVPTV
ncbi:MAG: protein-glutamate O-methyltransferase CheR [Planctomycetes bacterium]|nr:protein-glutamate O-methyltransferase CheR [Planctomycetota bacterium]